MKVYRLFLRGTLADQTFPISQSLFPYIKNPEIRVEAFENYGLINTPDIINVALPQLTAANQNGLNIPSSKIAVATSIIRQINGITGQTGVVTFDNETTLNSVGTPFNFGLIESGNIRVQLLDSQGVPHSINAGAFYYQMTLAIISRE